MNSSIDKICLCNHAHLRKINRRQLIKWITSTSLALPSWCLFSSVAHSSTQVKALVLSCIDFRLIAMEQKFLEAQNLAGKYDWLTLAGASLALSNFPSEADSKTFWEQLNLSVDLHQIEQVIIIDHQDCGAYATKFDPQLSQNPLKEKEIHHQYLIQARNAIVKRYPSFQVKLYFAHLNGEIEAISTGTELI